MEVLGLYFCVNLEKIAFEERNYSGMMPRMLAVLQPIWCSGAGLTTAALP